MNSPSVATEAANAPAPTSVSEKAADFEEFLFADEDEQEEATQEGDEETLELEGDEGEEDSEPDEPAIAPPPSLNAEEKTVFAQLPPEAQQAWAASENRRNTQVQEATTKAAAKEREAQTALERADAQAGAHYAAQLRAFADAFRPQMPDPQLAYADPQRYIAEKAQYDAQLAQFNDLEQQIAGVREQALGKIEQVDLAARRADLMTVPKLADPATQAEYLSSSLELVKELGLDPAGFEKVAGSEDFRALDKIADWKAKAAKFDAAMSRQMQKVRAGKARTLRPGAAPTESRAANTSKAWERVKSSGKNKSAQADAMADWLEASGHL